MELPSVRTSSWVLVFSIYLFHAISNWFIYLRMFYTIHLRAKQEGVQFCLVTVEERFLVNKVAVLGNKQLLGEAEYDIKNYPGL